MKITIMIHFESDGSHHYICANCYKECDYKDEYCSSCGLKFRPAKSSLFGKEFAKRGELLEKVREHDS